MEFIDYMEALIPRLQSLKKDEGATPFFDCLSGAFVWSDERIFGLNTNEMGCLRAIFRYRTNLIVREQDLRFELLWNQLKQKCPAWIGFDPVRCSPDAELMAKYLEIRKNPSL